MLSIQNLHVSVDQKAILKGVSLLIKKGEVHALMGPNGSGKSTLSSTLLGHPNYQIESGAISLEKHKLNLLSPDARAKKGLFLAFQYPTAVSGVSVQNLLKTSLDIIRPGSIKSIVEFRKYLKEIAKTLNIHEEFLSRSINDGFSGGEKKRLEVLQMLVLAPKIAIFDETDSGLDVDSLKLISLGIKKAVEKNHTGCLIITHHSRILEYLKPDHVHVMLKGKIVKSNGPELITQIESHGYQQFK